jgi:hypothetical protein
MTLYYVFGEEPEVLVDRDDSARDSVIGSMRTRLATKGLENIKCAPTG